MAHPDFDTMLMLERRRNDLAAAEQSRLVKLTLDGQKESSTPGRAFHPERVYQALLRLAGQGMYLLGMHIQDWGCQLQLRYAAGGQSSQSAPCD